jgi:O-antigen/teichoic acid export membrane protein
LAGRGLVGRIVGGTVNYGLGQFLPQLIGFVLIPWYTDVLSAEEYGLMDLAAYWLGVFVLAMRLGVPGAVTRFYFDQPDRESLRDYVTTVSFAMLGLSATVGGLLLVAAPLYLDQTMPGLGWYGLLLVVIAAGAQAASDVQRRLMQAREEARYTAILNLATGLVGIALNILFVLGLGWGIWGVLVAQALQSLLFFAQAMSYLAPDLRGRWRFPMFRDSLKYGVGILPSHLVGAATPLLQRVMLVAGESIATVGVMGVAQRFASPMTIGAGAFNTAFVPVYFGLRKEDTADARRRIVSVAHFAWVGAVFVALGVSSAGPPVIRWVTPVDYHEASGLLPWFSVSFLAQMAYYLFGNEIIYSKKTSWLPLLTATSTVANVSVTAWLVHRGAGGVAVPIGAGAGGFAMAVLATWISQRLTPLPYPWARMTWAVVAGGMAFAFAASCPYPDDLARFAWSSVAVALFPAMLALTGDPTVGEALSRGMSWLRGAE